MPGVLPLQAALPGDAYLAELLRSLLALALVCAAAFFALRWFARRGFAGAFGAKAGAPVQVLQRVPLEPRKSLYVVRAGKRVLLIGTGEAGPPSLLAELEPDTLRIESAVEANGAPRKPDQAQPAAGDAPPPARPQ